ncbi:aldehyde dehydrogenase [Caulobacter vibrioides]|uniref:NADP+-dependent gamma-glutamyl-gamma-aminobutyraldehyde dehydrogenase n=1 Tax=Caulobacter vibrioides (strain NA1000 / CB15N) TaxID=565050 RepID=A0A0H3CB65_CAUVN|nr:aldehyde dehydrogenase [Caulobacter vibrioides]YP_002518616.1 NADP+-dependent gamma-glutamyl-gamma-aminobutyraldehyde dehydrogenase [Caulobacter vibrioides NA1000]ACL96708.1 NADP+-dependent gamma-glutamyl-gamma-aminobutyraldehyde dehydrogenase [Caulobacter vibrioides NA1000]QXZ51491.1 aldehyde dehydrogenase [Caulobacter vibrioides]
MPRVTLPADMTERLAKLAPPSQAVIDGDLVEAASGATFHNVSPRDGQVLNLVTACQADDVERAVAGARAAFEDGRWRDQGPRQKKAVLFRLAELMERDADELALLESLDVGKPISDARNVDIPLAINTCRWYAEALDKVYGEVGTSPADRLSYAVHEPLGVIGAIVPWNFPLHMAMWKVAPALAMGNSVVLKPAEQSPLTALKLGALALEAGLPPGVLNVIPGLGGVAGEALALSMDVDMIAFTGSGPVGRRLMEYSARSNLKRVSLELGGKSPQIVFADCPDLEAAAQAAAWGVFYNQGEVCTAASRLLVEAPIKDAFLARVIEVAKGMKVGDPLDPSTQFGAMVSERQMNTALDYIATADSQGARRVLGGQRVRQEAGGFYVEPTIFDQVRPDQTLAREEVFGPVLGVMTFSSEDEAMRLANDTVYGLAAGLWTADVSKALRGARRLKAGLVWVNGWDACDITMPFGGFKQSGFGRDRSLHALHKYADLKSVSVTLR